MKCNCDKNNNALIAPVVKHVYGNVLRLAIPLTKRVLEKIGDEIDVTDEDFIPSSEYPVQIVFSKESGTRYPVEATMRDGNIACMEDKGKLPIGTYAITVTCCDDNGNPYRFNQKSIVQVFDETREAGIVSPIEYEVQTWYLDAAIFLSLKGEDGVGIEDIETQTSTEIGGVNTVTFILTDGRTKSFTILNGSGSVDNEFDPLSQHPLSNQRITERFSEVDQSISDLFGDVDYDSSNKVIRFWDKGKTKTLALLDARPFIKDGMVNSVYISNNTLVITFNTDAGREAIGVPLTSVFNPNNYYNKTQTDSRIAAAVANINLSNYYNKSDSDNRFLRKDQFGRLSYQNASIVVLDFIELPPVPGQDDEEYPEGEPGAIIGSSSGHIIYYTLGDNEIVANDLGSSDRVIFFNKFNGKFYYYTNRWVEIATGGSGGIENETDPTVPTWVKAITQAQITAWNNKQSAIADLDDIRRGAALGETALQEHQDISGKANIADLAEVATSGSYNDLKNKPTIPAEQVNADWNASSGKAQILNKPTIPSKTSDLVNDSGFVTASQVPEGADLSTVFADALYDSQTHRINFYGKGDTNHQTVLAYIDASPFIVDGMVDNVTLVNGTLTITFNTASGKQPITLSLGDIFNASNYYTKTDTDTLLGGKVDKETGKSLMTDAERTKLAGLSNYDDTALAGRVSTLENEGFITTETDPTVPSWAKQPTKPTYTPQEVGALPADTPIPSKTSDLTNNSGFINHVLYYGTCDTAAGTMPKVCTVEAFPTVTDNGVTHAKDGTIIAVKFTASDTNTTDAPALNVNGIGAKAIMYNNAIVTSTAKNTTVAGTAKMIAYYRYDSSLDGGDGAWEYLGKSVDSNNTYSAMTQTEINSGATTTARTISPKLLRDNFILKSEVLQQFLEDGCKCLTMTLTNGVYSFFDTYDNALNHEEVINLIYEFFEENCSYVTIKYNGLIYIPYSYISPNDYGFMSVDIANGVIRYLVLTDVNYVINVSSSSVAIPSSLSDLTSDATHRTVTDAEKAAWDAKGSGTITGITMNGASKGTSGVVDLGTVITSHQDISGKADKSEMSVTAGTGNDADKTTIQLKSGTTATVLTTHQDISGKADVVPIVTVSTSGAVSQQLAPNTFYKFTGGVSSLTLTLDTTGTGLLTYFGKFVTASSGCQLSLPSTLTEAAGNATIEGGKTYEFHIVDNVIRISEV